MKNVDGNKKCLNLGPQMPDLGIFGLKLENNSVIFEIGTLEIAYLLNLALKQKWLNLESRMPYLDSFDHKCLISVFLGENVKNTSHVKLALSNFSNPKTFLKKKNT